MTGRAVRHRPPAAQVIGPACQGCGGCLLTCPENAIWPARGSAFSAFSACSACSACSAFHAFHGLAVLASRCTGCGDCAEICPADAIVIPEGCVG